MPLKIQLKPKERIIINGAIIEGQSGTRTELIILNKARIMRQKHIMQEGDANTPAKRLYFMLQMLYIDGENTEQYLRSYRKFLEDLQKTVTLPTLQKSLDIIEEKVVNAEYYDAMKICRDFIDVEEQLLSINSGE